MTRDEEEFCAFVVADANDPLRMAMFEFTGKYANPSDVWTSIRVKSSKTRLLTRDSPSPAYVRGE
jgi:hypothetical protein